MSHTPEHRKHVVVGLSGGVDSSVAAALLQENGYRVTGVMLRLWSEPGCVNLCCADDALENARQVAGILGIPFYVWDAKQEFRNQVVESFLTGYAKGITPNPCLVCNQEIRWGFMLQRAIKAFQADYLATGHYARLIPGTNNHIQLWKGRDRDKDQSYVLHGLDQNALRRTLLPLGELTKQQVREKAAQMDLPVADRPDSQDLCFVGQGDYRDFLDRSLNDAVQPGPIYNTSGEQLGTHPGLGHFTIGQRKGLGISPPRPHYVIRKNLDDHSLVVGTREELGRKKLSASGVNWICSTPPRKSFPARVKIRYQSPEHQAVIHPGPDHTAEIIFDDPLPDITPGQAAVIYQADRCLGGGIIEAGEND